MEWTVELPLYEAVPPEIAARITCQLRRELTERDDISVVVFSDDSEARIRSRRYASTDEKLADFVRGCEAHIAERYARDMTPRG
jgi:hypothetical protein